MVHDWMYEQGFRSGDLITNVGAMDFVIRVHSTGLFEWMKKSVHEFVGVYTGYSDEHMWTFVSTDGYVNCAGFAPAHRLRVVDGSVRLGI